MARGECIYYINGVTYENSKRPTDASASIPKGKIPIIKSPDVKR